jgi:transposase
LTAASSGDRAVSLVPLRPLIEAEIGRQAWNNPLRRGLGLAEFEAAFPDERACLAHVFAQRYGFDLPCPVCDRSTTWTPRANHAFGSRCCDSRIYPRGATIFHGSSRSLRSWFHAIQIASNATGTPSVSFFARYFGVSHKAAFRMAQQIRLQMAHQERPRTLGGFGRPVYLAETYVKRVRRTADQKVIRKPVLSLVDTRSVGFAVLKSLRPAEVFRAIRAKVAPGTPLICADDALFCRLSGYRQRWHRVVLADMGARPLGMRSEVSLVVAKWVLRKLYGHVGEAQLGAYLEEQAFRTNAPHDKALFWTIMERFPDVRKAPA